MSSKFDQNTLSLSGTTSDDKLKVSKLMKLLEHHPYRLQVESAFKTDKIKNEDIHIDYIDVVYNRIHHLLKEFKRFNIRAVLKDISLIEHPVQVDGIAGVPIKFLFEEYSKDGVEHLNDLEAYAIHDSKNSFLNQFDMTKYANRLYKDKHYDLVRQNIDFFKSLSARKPGDKSKSYRLIEHGNELFVRGITSVSQYNEYGVDFAFVVTMLLFHEVMKDRPEDKFAISSAALSASKLEIIIFDKQLREAKGFGQVASSTIVTTNDLGSASFKFLNIVKVGIKESKGFYLFPDAKRDHKNQFLVTHSMRASNALDVIRNGKTIIQSAESFIEELEKVKRISKPDELRASIQRKIEGPNSPFRQIKSVKDLFNKVIDNNIENFVKLLEMCRKAEELDIDYDLKEKLRYIISDIILNK